LREQGKPIFVDFTADWCITCKANEANAISRDEVKAVIKQHGYATLKGDYTNSDPAITAVLKEFKRSGVPLYLVYPANPSGKAELLPQILTQDIVIAALKRGASEKQVASSK
jgi:thiol:disulfide interchange protein DsbD